MLTSTRQTKWIARFYVLIYLLLSTSAANASFWCQGAEASSHLESSPAGKCLADCALDAEAPQFRNATIKTAATLSGMAAADCFDSPACLSALPPSNQSSPRSKVAVIDLCTSDLFLFSAINSNYVNAGNPSFIFQLPPRQAMTALRTVALLH